MWTKNTGPLLPPGEGHLYLIGTDLLGPENRPSPLRRTWFSQLSTQERDRFGRYLFAKDRDLYLSAHGLLRHLLTAYCPDTPPSEWAFVPGDHGKPRLLTEAGIHFNLSHAGRQAAVLLARSAPCGVDIEPVRAIPRCLELSRRYFAAGEYRAVEAAASPDRRFLEFWTCKEACAKTLGLGLQLDFGAFDLSTGAETLELPATGVEPVRRHRVHWRGFIRDGYCVAAAFLRENTKLTVFQAGETLFSHDRAPLFPTSQTNVRFH